MGTTFTTSQECYTFITATSETVSSSTRPSEGALDLYRDVAYRLIYRYIQTSTDSNGIAKGVELQLVRVQALAALNGSMIILQLTEDMAQQLQQEFDLMVAGTYEPNQDGALTD